MPNSRNKIKLNFIAFFFIIIATKAQVPTVSSFYPTYGKTGDSITIKGSGFTGITGTASVKFGITSAAGYRIVNDTTLRAKLSNGSSGSISVTKSAGTASLAGFVFCGALSYYPSFKTSTLNVSCGSTYTYIINKLSSATEYSWFLNRGGNAKATITHINPLGENDTAILVTFLDGFTKDSICVRPLNQCITGSLGKVIPVGTYLPPSVDTITSNTNNLTPCIGDVVTYTANAPTPNSSQCAVTKYRWTAIPANTTIVSASSDSSSISIRYDLNFTGGSISVKGISGCGYLSTSAKTIILGYYPPSITSISASSGAFNVCPDYTETFTVKTDSPGVSQRSAQRYTWTLPANSIIQSANTDSSMIILKFLTGFQPSSITVSGVTSCNVKGTGLTKALTLNLGCISAPDTIYGPQELCNYFVDYTTTGAIEYSVDTVPGADYYKWILPTGVTTQVDPSNTTNSITVYVDNSLTSNYGAGRIYCAAVNIRGTNWVTESGYTELRLFRTIPVLGYITGPTNICPFIGRDTILTYEVARGNNINQYLWEVPVGVEVISGIDSNVLRVKFNQSFISNTSIKINGYANCGAISPRSLTFLRPLITAPAAIRKSFTPLVNAITNVAGVSFDTLRIRKVNNATNYDWKLSRGSYATITHLNGLGVNDTTIVVNLLSGFTLDTVAVAAATDCDKSTYIRIALSAMALPPAATSVSGSLTPCIGDSVTYTAITPTPSSIQAPVVMNHWTIPANTQIVTASGDSSSIRLKFKTGYNGGFIGVRTESPSGVLSTLTYKVTLKYATVAVTAITSSTSSLNACIGDSITYYATIPATLSSSQAAIVRYIWTRPNNTSILGNTDSPSVKLQFNTGYTGGSITVKGQTACGVFGTSKLANLTHTGCATGSKISPFTTNSMKAISAELSEFILYPNPTFSEFNLRVNTKSSDPVMINIFDLQGRLIKSAYYIQNAQLGKDLSTGIYLFEINQGKFKKTIKAVKL